MKKVIMIFCMLMTLFATNMFAQEKVRGIEARLVKTGVNAQGYDLYAIEFTNLNSISVSVAIELWKKGTRDNDYKDRIYLTKDIVLKPNESYTWKIEKTKTDDGVLRDAATWPDYYDYYYYKYEAYKLQ